MALPYVTAPGNIEKALKAIQEAQTPERVSQDFVKTILQISGGSGDQMTSFLKKIGFVNSDGSPSGIYTKFRNHSSSGSAMAEALRIGYQPLYQRNEYMHNLADDKLKGLVIEETGLGSEAPVVGLICTAIKNLKKFADFKKKNLEENIVESDKKLITNAPLVSTPSDLNDSSNTKLNLSYTINLNLPATSDVAVFNAIFKSLKENLIKGGSHG